VDDARWYGLGVARQPINRVAVVGTGVVGSSWAACFLARGLDVIASDPAPGAEKRLRAAVALHWPALERIGLAAGASVERLAFAASPENAVATADFVQESGPERADTKQQLFAQLDSAARPSTLLAQFLGPGLHGDSGSLHTPRARPDRSSVQPASPRPTCRGGRRRAHRSGGHRSSDGLLFRAWEAPHPT
jgi:3-hydroxyacyl-CoA dehydrogenase, NAD binding domain